MASTEVSCVCELLSYENPTMGQRFKEKSLLPILRDIPILGTASKRLQNVLNYREYNKSFIPYFIPLC